MAMEIEFLGDVVVGGRGAFRPGDRAILPDEDARPIIDAGHARPVVAAPKTKKKSKEE